MVYVAEQESPYYTFKDFLAWDESERCELINGETYMLAAPSRLHQELSRNIFIQLAEFLKGKPCQAFYAPFAVRLNPKKDYSDDTVVEPDIVVVCDSDKLDDRGCNGAPDLIIEILSPGTVKTDRLVKFNKYLDAEVREYWMVDGDAGTVEVCILDKPPEKKGRYMLSTYAETDTINVSVLPGCAIDLKPVFAAAS